MSNDITHWSYEVEVVRERDGVGFGPRPVPESYLDPAREHLLFQGQRRGIVDDNATGTSVADTPAIADGTIEQVRAIEFHLVNASESLSQRFDTNLLKPFWQRLVGELLDAKQLDENELVRLRAYAHKSNGVPQAATSNDHVKVIREPLPLLEGSIRDLLSDATAMGPVNERDYPVFITASAIKEACQIVWERNRERGVWLIGNLYRQQDPHEIYCVAHTVVEARGTKHERFSLDFTTATFIHMEQQLALIRTRFGRPHDVALLFLHTHPFLPSVLDNMEACPTCSLRPTCTLTSSFFSQRDQTFHTAMFGATPYAVEMVLGLTPREEFDLKMFCYDGGIFRERGYYQVADRTAASLSLKSNDIANITSPS
jgi:hypothetical protein